MMLEGFHDQARRVRLSENRRQVPLSLFLFSCLCSAMAGACALLFALSAFGVLR
jgi:hypothetical protein